MKSKSYSYGLLEEALAASGKSISELETLAKDAKNTGLIDDRAYKLLQSIVPFEGYPQETLEAVRSRMKVSRVRIEQIKDKTYRAIARYSRQPKAETLYDVELNLLPWDRKNVSMVAINALSKFFGRMPTVEDVITLFGGVAAAGENLNIIYYGKAALRDTYQTFNRVGVQLPDLKIA